MLYPAHGKKMAGGKESRKTEKKKAKRTNKKELGGKGHCRCASLQLPTPPAAAASKATAKAWAGEQAPLSWWHWVDIISLWVKQLWNVGLGQQRHCSTSALDFHSPVCICCDCSAVRRAWWCLAWSPCSKWLTDFLQFTNASLYILDTYF